MGKLAINKKLNVYLFVLLFLWGCNSSANKKVIIKIDSNGDTLSVITYSNDTIQNGLAKYYYKGTGAVMEEIMFKNDKKDGLYKFYYPNQKLEAEAIYKNNLQNGKSYDYSISGNLITEGNWLDDNPFGNFTDYYSNGKIKRYRSFDFEHNLRYVSNYDSLGKLMNEIGTVLGQFRLYSPTDTVLIENEFKGDISIATPPHYFVKVVSGESSLTNKELLIKDGIAEYRTMFMKKGEHTITTVGEFINGDKKSIKSDTIFTKVYVK